MAKTAQQFQLERLGNQTINQIVEIGQLQHDLEVAREQIAELTARLEATGPGARSEGLLKR